MGFGRWYNAQRAGVQAAVVGGVLTVAAGVVAGVFGIVDVELAKPSAQNSTPVPPPTLTVSALAPVTSASSEPTATSSSPAPRIVFSDRFCTTAGGWTVGSGQTGGRYGSCAFRVYANANDIESSEPRARVVYPAAPSGIEITVTARRILGAAEGDAFGVACRADGEGYAFIVRSDLVEIIKYSSNTGQIGQPLAQVPATVDMNARNKIQATCATASDGAAQLALSVNGKKFATATDTNMPIPRGTVGIFAATTSATQTPTEAEFEDFTVAQL